MFYKKTKARFEFGATPNLIIALLLYVARDSVHHIGYEGDDEGYGHENDLPGTFHDGCFFYVLHKGTTATQYCQALRARQYEMMGLVYEMVRITF